MFVLSMFVRRQRQTPESDGFAWRQCDGGEASQRRNS
jgi:hypothetical protein